MRTKGSSPECGSIYVRITVNKQRKELSIKKSFPVDKWDKAKGKAKGGNADSKALNFFLDRIHSKLLECYQELSLNQERITAEMIKEYYLGNHQKKHTISELIQYHDSTQSMKLSENTKKSYRVTAKYIHLFVKRVKKSDDISLTRIDYRFLADFDFFLRTFKPKDHKCPVRNNGVMKHMQRFRKILGLGVRLEWISRNPFDSYEIRFDKAKRGFLSLEELKRIESKNFNLTRLQQIKDLFIFSCYTGLSYCDAISLTPKELVKGDDGEIWINTERTKNNIPVNIPLLPKALEIIEKYKDNPRSINRGTIFPLISNQKLNNYLKEIAEICEIEKNLTFHLARHTFATTITLTNGVPIETVSKLLGHTCISTTQIYAKVIEIKISKDMCRLKKRLEKADETV
ncbi:MAG: site-specific integrase [Mariniphaga sp.]|nr:site-specific integrase [Mariniphaga sp.]